MVWYGISEVLSKYGVVWYSKVWYGVMVFVMC